MMVRRLKPSLSMHDIARLCDEHEALTADLARVTAERDALRAEVDALRSLLREARAFVDDATGGCPDAIHRVAGDEGAREAQAMLDRIDEALR